MVSFPATPFPKSANIELKPVSIHLVGKGLAPLRFPENRSSGHDRASGAGGAQGPSLLIRGWNGNRLTFVIIGVAPPLRAYSRIHCKRPPPYAMWYLMPIYLLNSCQPAQLEVSYI